MSDEFDIDNMELEEIIPIDLEALNNDSKREAEEMLETVTSLFMDEQFRKEHPKTQKRIHIELDTLRGLIKMRKADEEAHDNLLIAISENKSNASLYRSMAEIQKTSIAISNKIHDTIERLNVICKEFQVDAPIQTTAEQQENIQQDVHKGSKSFIQSMLTD